MVRTLNTPHVKSLSKASKKNRAAKSELPEMQTALYVLRNADVHPNQPASKPASVLEKEPCLGRQRQNWQLLERQLTTMTTTKKKKNKKKKKKRRRRRRRRRRSGERNSICFSFL
jgi:hypothetical protein